MPLVPYLVWGRQLEQALAAWQQYSWGPPATVLIVVATLAADLVLPVPSSFISTAGGSSLGAWTGTAASWVGMTLGAMLGFAIARRWGRPVALWFTSDEELDRMQRTSDRWGPGVLVLARGLPLLAEASVLLMGVHQLSWRRFLPPVVLSNLGISLAYAHFGELAQRYEILPVALGVSIGLPVLVAMVARSRWRR